LGELTQAKIKGFYPWLCKWSWTSPYGLVVSVTHAFFIKTRFLTPIKRR